jgi:hypothetical protein
LAEEIFKLPDAGRVATKFSLRGELGHVWGDKSRLEEEAHTGWGYLTREETVKAMKKVMQGLSKPKDKAKI